MTIRVVVIYENALTLLLATGCYGVTHRKRDLAYKYNNSLKYLALYSTVVVNNEEYYFNNIVVTERTCIIFVIKNGKKIIFYFYNIVSLLMTTTRLLPNFGLDRYLLNLTCAMYEQYIYEARDEYCLISIVNYGLRYLEISN